MKYPVITRPAETSRHFSTLSTLLGVVTRRKRSARSQDAFSTALICFFALLGQLGGFRQGVLRGDAARFHQTHR